MSSWVAVCPSAHLPWNSKYSSTNEARMEANKGSPIHRRREEAVIPLRCRWAQKLPFHGDPGRAKIQSQT
jgi:hypothetical protein